MPESSDRSKERERLAPPVAEIPHDQHHPLRRKTSKRAGLSGYIAELGSAFLCAEAGSDNSELDNSAAYIQSWLKVLKNDKRLIVSASSQAAKAARYILGQKDEGDPGGEGTP